MSRDAAILERAGNTADERSYAVKLGAHIQVLRKQWKVNTWELAEFLGVNRNTLRHWEIGKSMPDPYRLDLLTRYFAAIEKGVLKP